MDLVDDAEDSDSESDDDFDPCDVDSTCDEESSDDDEVKEVEKEKNVKRKGSKWAKIVQNISDDSDSGNDSDGSQGNNSSEEEMDYDSCSGDELATLQADLTEEEVQTANAKKEKKRKSSVNQSSQSPNKRVKDLTS